MLERRRHRLRAALLAGFVLAQAAASPVPAQTDGVVFELAIGQVRAGTLSIEARQSDRAYAVDARLETTGIAAILRRISFTGRVDGRVRRGRLAPQRYESRTEVGAQVSSTDLVWQDGVPQVLVLTPQPEPAPDRVPVDAATQGGSVDPLTALHAVLGDAAPDAACNRTLLIYDGRRSSRIAVGPPVGQGDGLVCSGEYRRLQGFTPAELMERSRFGFTLTLRPGADGRWQVAKVVMVTLVGRATLTRR